MNLVDVLVHEHLDAVVAQVPHLDHGVLGNLALDVEAPHLHVTGAQVGVEGHHGSAARARQRQHRRGRLGRQCHAVGNAQVASRCLVRKHRHALCKARGVAIHRAGGGADDAVVEKAIIGPQGHLAVTFRIPCQAQTRREIVPVVVVPLAALLDGQVVDLAGRVEVRRLVQRAGLSVELIRHAAEVPTQTQVQGQIPRGLPIVLHEEAVFVKYEVAHTRRARRLPRGQVAVEALYDRPDAPEQVIVKPLENRKLRRIQPRRLHRWRRVARKRRAQAGVGIDARGVVSVLRRETDIAASLEGVVAANLGDVVGVLVDR